MSSHEMFMNVYANDRRVAWLDAAQAHRQSKSAYRPSEANAAWRSASRIIRRIAWPLTAYRKSVASYHA